MRKRLKAAFDALSDAVTPMRQSYYGDVLYNANAYGTVYARELRPEGEGHYSDAPRVWVFAVNGDYVGDLSDAANRITLRREFGDLFTNYADSMGAEGLCIVEGRSYRPEVIERLATVLDRLNEYPLLSDEDYSELISGVADEQWDAWLSHDLPSEVASTIAQTRHVDMYDLRDTIADDDDHMSALRQAYYEDAWWVSEGGNGVRNERHQYAIRKAAKTFWETGTFA